LPWNHRGWHAGGTANNSHIGFEICEDNLADASYFNSVYKEATELCAYLCKLYDLTEKDIIGHYEGSQKKIASNHADPGHWFSRHGKSMDTFRGDVKKLLTSTASGSKKLYRVQIGAYSVKSNAEAMLAKAKAAGFKDAFIKIE
jgi:N-acetylmuramoyl-L-alanine amidase